MSDATYIFEQNPDNDTFGGRLSRAREASGTSMKDLAWQLSVKTSTVNGWETDRAQPSANRLAKISGLLSVSLSWLLHGVGPAPIEEDDRELSTEGLTQQLSKLQSLHASTGDIIDRLQQDIGRLERTMHAADAGSSPA